jgi:hypothetical protein
MFDEAHDVTATTTSKDVGIRAGAAHSEPLTTCDGCDTKVLSPFLTYAIRACDPLPAKSYILMLMTARYCKGRLMPVLWCTRSVMTCLV